MDRRTDIGHTLGAVLAGGQGRRMDGSKASAPLGGRAMIEHPLAVFAEAGIAVVVVAKAETALPPLDVPVWHDRDAASHPLAGIVTALRGASGSAVVVCGCDMPFVNAELLAWLANHREQVVVPRVDGRLQPLLARYGPGVLAALEVGLAAEAPMQQTVAMLGPRIVDERQLARFGDPRRLVENVNTPAQLAAAEALL